MAIVSVRSYFSQRRSFSVKLEIIQISSIHTGTDGSCKCCVWFVFVSGHVLVKDYMPISMIPLILTIDREMLSAVVKEIIRGRAADH